MTQSTIFYPRTRCREGLSTSRYRYPSFRHDSVKDQEVALYRKDSAVDLDRDLANETINRNPDSLQCTPGKDGNGTLSGNILFVWSWNYQNETGSRWFRFQFRYRAGQGRCRCTNLTQRQYEQGLTNNPSLSYPWFDSLKSKYRHSEKQPYAIHGPTTCQSYMNGNGNGILREQTQKNLKLNSTTVASRFNFRNGKVWGDVLIMHP